MQPETAPTQQVATKLAAEIAPDLPPIECTEGARPQAGKSANGIEQWCERDGVMHGPYNRFHDDGTKAVDGMYADNAPDGNWLWKHPNGTKASKGTYRKGKQAGSWTWWHPNGMRAQEGDFLAGRKAGHWTAWFDEGSKKEMGLYHNGNKHGDWSYFKSQTDEDLARTETWQRGVLVQTVLPAPPETTEDGESKDGKSDKASKSG
jgi:hypothetical protein